MSLPATLLFDFGGTLDHDGRHWPVRWLDCFRRAGAAIEEGEFLRRFRQIDRDLNRRHDLSRAGYAETALLLGKDLAAALAPGLGERAAEEFTKESLVYLERNRPLLERLGHGRKLGLVSNFYGNLDAVLDSVGYGGLFDAAADSEKVGAEKPDPRIFRWALERLGTRPEDALMVGDSPPADMRGAEALGMPHVLLGGSAPCCPAGRTIKTLPDLEALLNAPKAAGIIAAGLGERLKDRGPKPLVEVGGRPLVHWVVSGLAAAGVERVTVLFNSRSDAAREGLAAAFPNVRFEFLRADTPSSFASFKLVAGTLARAEERFLMSTVDALVPPAEARRFAEAAFAAPEPDAAVALTRFVEDEKPLWAELGPDGLVRAFGAAARHDAVTCGLYALTRRGAAALPEDAPALRAYWSGLAAAGRPVRGILLSDTVDVDRPEDLAAAERLVSCFAA